MDTRRFVGPEGSFSYRPLVKDPKPKKLKEKTKSEGIFLRTDVLSQAQGSAYIEQGGTKVVCAVYGPREIPRRSDFSMKGLLLCHLSWTSFSGAPHAAAAASGGGRGDQQQQQQRRGAQPEEREASLVMQEALQSAVCLHLYPKSQIDVFVSILEDDGSALAASITCAGLALASASIHMYDLIVGVSTKVDQNEPKSRKAERQGKIFATIGYLPNLEQIATTVYEGVTEPQLLIQEIEELSQRAKQMVPMVQDCLLKSISESN